jgi:hypothetical protein
VTAESSPRPPVRRQLRVLGILSGAAEAGFDPLAVRQLHSIAYFADALAPVWDLEILDAQLLKRREGPTSPALQRDIDLLVGSGVIEVSSVKHSEDADGLWRLDADYSLNSGFAEPILAAAREFAHFDLELRYVREVALALSGLGALGIEQATALDASYGNERVDFGDMVDIEDQSRNPTAQVAERFEQLLRPEVSISNAEQIHLYVDALYSRLSN